MIDTDLMIKEEKLEPTKRRPGRPSKLHSTSITETEDDEDQELIEAQIILRHVSTGTFQPTNAIQKSAIPITK